MYMDNKNPNYKGSSGGGSRVKNNKEYINLLKKFIEDNNIKKVIDLGCGEYIYNDLDIEYYGYDTYSKLIKYHSKIFSLPKYNFIHLDIYNKKEEIIG